MVLFGAMSEPKILVVGSLAFDIIFSIPTDFRQSIPLEEGRIRNFNATYLADKKQEFPGGTAGNIALWLQEERLKCSVFSAWGRDLLPKGYHEKLVNANVDLRGTEGEFTACCYAVSDPLHQQLIIWQPNSYSCNETQNLSDFYEISELEAFDYVIFAAGSPVSTKRHMAEFRQYNQTATVLFDPGQMTPFFMTEDFKACVELSNFVLGNDIEGQHFDTYMADGWPDKIERIITLGDRGARYWAEDEWHYVDPVEVEPVVETTGAGDAFRAGLLAGLVQNKNLAEAVAEGSKLGAQCVQLPAGQPL